MNPYVAAPSIPYAELIIFDTMLRLPIGERQPGNWLHSARGD